MKKFYKSNQIILKRENITDVIIRDSYDKKSLLDICNADGSIKCRLTFNTKAEAEEELNRIYGVIAPRYDKVVIVFTTIALAVALTTYTVWYPLLTTI
jgi:hypothetical protein